MPRAPKNTVQTVLVLQGGGALGAYQAGAYAALAKGGHVPDWVAGISIGSINAALIAGNPPAKRSQQLRAFWEQSSRWLPFEPPMMGSQMRSAYTEWAASMVAMWGVPGFFKPRLPSMLPGAQATSYYDTSALRETLLDLVDFEYLNTRGPRLSVGAVEVETGNFAYFDSAEMTIRPEHIMASGALPPGFDAIEIDGKHYWDGGLVSNTPLQFVLENAGPQPLEIFQVDLFSASGDLPTTLAEVSQRQKDIQFSSRTRLNTDRFHELHNVAAAAKRLRAKLPDNLHNDPDIATLCEVGPQGPVTLMHLIHRKEGFEGASKDYEFSYATMRRHWQAGESDVTMSLTHKDWTGRVSNPEDITVFDFGNPSMRIAS